MKPSFAPLLALVPILLFAPGFAAERVALVIGNGAYEHVAPLENPLNDAKAIAGHLADGGYEVTLVEDGGVTEMAFALKRFARTAAKADLAVFFFAGHGFEVSEKNYLAPVDARLEIDPGLPPAEAELALDFALERETIPLELVMRELRDTVSGLKLIVLDCCRNNPFAKSRGWARTRSGSGGGLAPVAEREMPEGTMMVFSGEPGKEVPDGAGRHSPFTAALLAEIESERNAGIMKLFTGLSKRIESDQKPWLKFDGTGQSVAAFVEEPLLPGDGNTASIPTPAAPAPMAEAPKPVPADSSTKEQEAKMAAEIRALGEQIAALEAKNRMAPPAPAPPEPEPALRAFHQSQWVIACEAEETKALAEKAAARWASRGFPAGVLFIPDYSSLSKARLWLAYVGPWDYSDREAVKATLGRVKSQFRNAYGIKVDQSGKRETIP